MSRPGKVSRIVVALMWLVPGTVVLGSSCAKDVRDTLIDAVVGFVGDAASELLRALFPVADWLDGGEA